MPGSPKKRLKKLWVAGEYEQFKDVSEKLIIRGDIEEADLAEIKEKADELRLKQEGKSPKKKI